LTFLHILIIIGGMKLVRKFAIPAAYVVVSVLLDVILHVSMGSAFPSHYFFSLAFTLVFACIIACVPNRIWQTVMCTIGLGSKTVLVIANMIGYSLFEELFTFQNLRGWHELLLARHDAQFSLVLELVILASVLLSMLCFCIFCIVKFKPKKDTGFRTKSIVAVCAAIALIFSAQSLHYTALKGYYENAFDNVTTNKKFNFDSFSNKHFYMTNFGLTMFYVRNLLEITNISASSFPIDSDHKEFATDDWTGKYDYQLDTDNNLIMLLMESVEYDAINPVLTPNLWKIKEMSTSVNGYYGMERTCMSDYIAMTGSHLQTEMWRDYRNVDVPQALPNVFKRAGYDQTGVFHNFDKNYYGRSSLHTTRLGFDDIYDHTDYPEAFPNFEYSKRLSQHSDEQFMKAAVGDIAPGDKSFFNYFLNVAPHSSHFDSPSTRPTAERDAHNRPVYVSDFEEPLKQIYANYEDLRVEYPKLDTVTDAEHRAIMAYMVGVRDYDNSIGIMLKHLETTPDTSRNGKNAGKMLIDTTAIVLFSDHYNYTAYKDTRNRGAGLLAAHTEQSPIGEKLSFMIYNPEDREALDGGNTITRFMSNMDIYKTVAHLFNIETNTRFTLGASILDDQSHSIGIGFISARYFGLCHTTNGHFSTRDFQRFAGATPCDGTFEIYRDRVSESIYTISALQKLYRANALKDTHDAFYTIKTIA